MLETLVLGQGEASTTTGTILFVLLSFSLLTLLVKKFAWGPVVSMMEKREDKIANDLDSAETSRIAAAKLEEERQKALLNSRSEAVNIVNTAKQSGEQSRQSIIEEAKEDAEQIKAKAQIELQRQQERVQRELKKDAAALSLELASKILNEKLDENAHQAMIDDFINELGNHHEA